MSIINEQKQRHVYLTDIRCDATDHVNQKQLHELQLDYGWVNEQQRIIPAHGLEVPKNFKFYPLTPEEAAFISTQGFVTGEGCIGYTSYATLFQGKKWLTPIIKIGQINSVDQSTLSLRLSLISRGRNHLARIGGDKTIYAEKHEDGVALHIPMEWALENLISRNGFTFDHYCGFLVGLML